MLWSEISRDVEQELWQIVAMSQRKLELLHHEETLNGMATLLLGRAPHNNLEHSLVVVVTDRPGLRSETA